MKSIPIEFSTLQTKRGLFLTWCAWTRKNTQKEDFIWVFQKKGARLLPNNSISCWKNLWCAWTKLQLTEHVYIMLENPVNYPDFMTFMFFQ